jgi:hypothetical protein
MFWTNWISVKRYVRRKVTYIDFLVEHFCALLKSRHFAEALLGKLVLGWGALGQSIYAN